MAWSSSEWSSVFFPLFLDEVRKLSDLRDPELVDYTLCSVLWTPILMFVCRLGARRKIHHVLNTPRLARYLSLLAQEQLSRVPHGDTVCDVLKGLRVDQLGRLRTMLVRWLIQDRCLEKFRLLGRYYLVTLDGTGFLALGNKPGAHTEGCLRRKLSNGQTLYYRPVLEAKLVTRTSLALSVGSEFPENPRRPGQSQKDYKQDCELKAAYRLLPRLKKEFPRLGFCLLLDALFACEPVFALCESNKWAFITVLQNGSLPSVQEEFKALVGHDPKGVKLHTNKHVKQVIRWVNHIAYKEHTLNVLECVETNLKTGKTTRWLWVTNILITPENCVEVANLGGRQRWRTENEGFNVQKNGGYEMEHAYSQDPTAAKNFYLLLQIAHTFAQLFECRMGGKQAVVAHWGSLAELADALKRSFLDDDLPTDRELRTFLETPIQVRLDSS